MIGEVKEVEMVEGGKSSLRTTSDRGEPAGKPPIVQKILSVSYCKQKLWKIICKSKLLDESQMQDLLNFIISHHAAFT